MAEIFPAEMFGQMIVIVQDIFKLIAGGRHQQRAGPTMTAQKIFLAFFERDQPVKRRTKLTAERLVIERRSEDDDIAFLNGRINFSHIVVLYARHFQRAVCAEAAAAAVDVHIVRDRPGKTP